jgi:ABC-type phosphate transport system substrate-binding protein
MLTALVAGVALFCAAPAGAADFKLIVHPSNPATSLSRDEVSAMFLQKTTQWPGGAKVVPVDQTEGALYADFCEAVFGKSAASMKAYWQQKIFSGRAIPPVSKSGDAAVAAFVASYPGAIGYVSAGAAAGDAKVVTLR